MADLEYFVEMGFSRLDAVRALELSGGNKEMAIDKLLSGSLDVPHESVQLRTEGINETMTTLCVSQYTFSELGSSACTSIAFSAMVALLKILNTGSDQIEDAVITESILSGVTNHTNYNESSQHISAEEYFDRSPDIQSKIIKICEPLQGLLTDDVPFRNLMVRAQDAVAALAGGVAGGGVGGLNAEYIGIIITKPPETVCIIIPSSSVATAVDAEALKQQYIFFDSHSRPQFGIDGSYFVKSDNIESVLLRLNTIFPCPTLDFDEGDTYMKMLYTSFEGTVFKLI